MLRLKTPCMLYVSILAVAEFIEEILLTLAIVTIFQVQDMYGNDRNNTLYCKLFPVVVSRQSCLKYNVEQKNITFYIMANVSIAIIQGDIDILRQNGRSKDILDILYISSTACNTNIYTVFTMNNDCTVTRESLRQSLPPITTSLVNIIIESTQSLP